MGFYQSEVGDVLDQLQSEGRGRKIEVSPGTFGMSIGDNPQVLLTAGYHANEIYATYQSLLDIARHTSHPCTIVPVVDTKRFETFKEDSEKHKELPKSYELGFLYDSIKGFHERPEVMPWQFGEEDACPEVKGLSRLIDNHGLVIDLHNSCINGYVLIYNPSGIPGEQEFVDKAIEDLGKSGEIFDGYIGNNSNMVKKGLFQCRLPRTVAAYASSNGVMNLVLEVPIMKDNKPLDFERTQEFVSSYLDGLLCEYYRLRREKNGDQ